MLKPVSFLVTLVLVGGCPSIPLIYWWGTSLQCCLFSVCAGGSLLQSPSCPLLQCWKFLHSQFNAEGSPHSSRSPLCQKPPLRLPASCGSHAALELGCGFMKQMGCSVQRSLMKNAAIPSCNSDCGSQLFPPCSGYQQSWEICYLRLRRKPVQYKNTFRLFCFSCFSSSAHL